MKFIQLLILLSFVSCKSHSDKLIIDKSVQKELKLNKAADDTSDLIDGTSSYFTFSSKEMNKLFGVEDSTSSINKMLLGTEEILQRNVCGCQLKNDTITLTGGIFYGGGIGYQIKINKKKFDGKIILASTSKKYKKEKNGEFHDELYLNNKKQILYLTEEPIFELGKIIKGKVVMESQDFFTKNENGFANDKCWMKVIFECKLTKHGPL